MVGHQQQKGTAEISAGLQYRDAIVLVIFSVLHQRDGDALQIEVGKPLSHRVGTITDHYHEPVDTSLIRIENYMLHQRPAVYLHQRLGHTLRQRTKPAAIPCGEDETLIYLRF